MPKYNNKNRSFAQAVKSVMTDENVDLDTDMIELKNHSGLSESKEPEADDEIDNFTIKVKNKESDNIAPDASVAPEGELKAEPEEAKEKTVKEKTSDKDEKMKEKKKDEKKPVIKKETQMAEIEKELSSSEEIVSFGEDTTFITKDTQMSGNIESEGDVEVRGRVDGNVKCTGKLIVSGKITGDINAGDLYGEEANITGEIRVSGTVKIGAGSVTVGNIYAEKAVVAGAVKGDMDIRDEVVLESTAIVVGNIKSKSVDISSGAIVDGFCKQVYASIDVDKYFNSDIESLS